MSIENNAWEYMDYILWGEEHESILLIDLGWMPVPRWVAVLTR